MTPESYWLASQEIKVSKWKSAWYLFPSRLQNRGKGLMKANESRLRKSIAGLGKIQIHVLCCMLRSWLFLTILNNLKCLAPFSFTQWSHHLIPALCAHKRKGELSSQGCILSSVRSKQYFCFNCVLLNGFFFYLFCDLSSLQFAFPFQHIQWIQFLAHFQFMIFK